MKTPQLSSPMRFGHAHNETAAAPPTLGQHSDEVLGELGYPPSMIQALRASGVI